MAVADFFLNYQAHVMVAMFAMGTGLVFFQADRETPSSRVLAELLVVIGLALLWEQRQGLTFLPDWPLVWHLVDHSLVMIAMLLGLEWVRRVQRTVAQQDGRRWFGGLLPRLAQSILFGVWVIGFVFPDLPQVRYDLLFSKPSVTFHLGFWVFALPIWVAMLVAWLSIAITILRRPDKAERDRLRHMVLAAPLLMSGIWLPPDMKPLWAMPLTGLGLLIFNAGMMRYLVAQGQRGHFMSRFMSPEVTRLMRHEGMKRALQRDEPEVSVVACDMRGFTAWSAEHDSKEVLAVLHEYYKVVGEAARELGATVKDHAGDGILMLVGAPIELVDHRERALKLAEAIREQAGATLAQLGGGALGLGVGVASGKVTVGAIGGAARLEYAAVGVPVNLAARLCDKAANGCILLAEDSVVDNNVVCDPQNYDLKGFAEPVQAWRVKG